MVEKSEKASIVIPDNLMKFLDKNGWPTFLVFIIGMAGWNFTTWLKPRFDKLLDNHFETVKSLTETQAQQVKNGEQLIGIAKAESEIHLPERLFRHPAFLAPPFHLHFLRLSCPSLIQSHRHHRHPWKKPATRTTSNSPSTHSCLLRPVPWLQRR